MQWLIAAFCALLISAAPCAAGDVVFKKSKVITVEEPEPKERDAVITLSDSILLVVGLNKIEVGRLDWRYETAFTLKIPYGNITKLTNEQAEVFRITESLLLSPLFLGIKKKRNWCAVQYLPENKKSAVILLRTQDNQRHIFNAVMGQRVGEN